MRTRKQCIAMAFIAIITIVIIGCKQDEPEDEPPPPTPQPYGTLPNGVKIYKGEGVTDAQMATTVQEVIKGYNGVTPETLKPEIDKVLTKIIIISDKNYSWDGHILGLKYGFEAADIQGVFEVMAAGNLEKK